MIEKMTFMHVQEQLQSMKLKDIKTYMSIAKLVSERSYATRLKVGCVIEKGGSIISIGWNGMPAKYDNTCENEYRVWHMVSTQQMLANISDVSLSLSSHWANLPFPDLSTRGQISI